jgi:hypothetical protein
MRGTPPGPTAVVTPLNDPAMSKPAGTIGTNSLGGTSRVRLQKVDPGIHNSNTYDFKGRRLRVRAIDQRIPQVVALRAIRTFVGNVGRVPTAEAWTAARMTPSEKTIRRRFGSFRAAVIAAKTDR